MYEVWKSFLLQQEKNKKAQNPRYPRMEKQGFCNRPAYRLERYASLS